MNKKGKMIRLNLKFVIIIRIIFRFLIFLNNQ